MDEREAESLASALFWIERLLLTLLFVFYESISDLIGPLFLFTTLLTLVFFILCPKLSSAGPSGIGGFWLFLSDRFMFLLALEGSEFLWRLTVLMTLMNHSVYVIEYLVRFSKLHHGISLRRPRNEIPISTELRGIDDDTVDVGDMTKEVEKIRELLKELREDEKKMDIEIELLEHIINSGLEPHRKAMSLKLLELREELKYNGEKMRRYMELVKNFVHSEIATLRDDLRLNVDEIYWKDICVDEEEDIKAARSNVMNFVTEEVCENYLVIRETAKAAKTTADRSYLTYLAAQSITDEVQNMRCIIKEEDLEEFVELREEVRRMSLDFEARRMEAEVIAERAKTELSSAMLELVEAFGI